MRTETRDSTVALVIGASGMAGQAFVNFLKAHNYNVVGLSRNGPNILFDAMSYPEGIESVIGELRPAIIVNCAAIVSLEHCENNSEEAHRLNALLPKHIARGSSLVGARFLHISTDHYYTGDTDMKHSEEDPVTIVNKYAETKFIGESNALQHPNTLVVRTNITGFRGQAGRPTFIEWLASALINKDPLKLFTDFYTSTIDTSAFCGLCMSHKKINTTGILNIASSDTRSKKEFALCLAKQLGIDPYWAEDASVLSMELRRAESLGLDCSKVQTILGERMPNSDEVIQRLASQLKSVHNT